jgi:hypothetical protein
MTTQTTLHMNSAFQNVRVFAQSEAREINDNLRDTAAAVQQVGTKLDEIHSAPAAPPGDKPPAPAPVQAPTSPQPVAPDQTPGTGCPFAAGLPQHLSAVSAMFGGGGQPAFPAVPDYSRQLAEFVSTVLRNQETMLRTLEQALELCRRQEQEIESLSRQSACMAGRQ